MPAKQTRRWCFTSFEASPQYKLDNVEYLVVQCEICPTTNKEHYQGYLVTKKKTTLNVVKEILDDQKCHLEIANGKHDQCIAYCTKILTRKPNTIPYEYGNRNCIQSGKRTDLEEIVKLIKENDKIEMTYLIETFPGTVARNEKWIRSTAQKYKKRIIDPDIGRKTMTECEIIYGKTGSGKSTYVKEIKDCYWKNPMNNWWDGYTGQENVVIDDWTNDPKKGIQAVDLLHLVNHTPLSLEIKGGFTEFLAKKIWITTNLEPEEILKGLSEEHNNALKRRLKFTKI